jgi:penicillin-binding protein 2
LRKQAKRQRAYLCGKTVVEKSTACDTALAFCYGKGVFMKKEFSLQERLEFLRENPIFWSRFGIEYDNERIDEVTKKLLDVAVSYNSKSQWNKPIREILLYDLNLPESYIVSNYLGNSMVSMISELFWTDNETIMLAIGQSITQISPIAAARYVSAIANGGTVYDAQIVDKIISPDGEIVIDKEPVVANRISTDDSYFRAIRQGMEDVTSLEDGGTAGSYFKGIDYIAAKTGTSQRTELDVENNAWMVAYAPLDNPQIVVVAYIQNGYSGAYASNAIIKTINYYLENRGHIESTQVREEYTLAQ